MHRGRTVLAMDCALAGARWHRGRPLNSVVSHHVDPATKVTIRRVLAAAVGTVFLLAFLVTWLAFPTANSGVVQIFGVGALMAYGYALFPGIFPGQTRWDELDADTAAKSQERDPAKASVEAKRDG